MEHESTEFRTSPSLFPVVTRNWLSIPSRPWISDSSMQGLWSVFAASFLTAKELASARYLLFIESYFHCPLLDNTLLIFLFSTFPWIVFVERHVLGSRKAPCLKGSFSVLKGTLISRGLLSISRHTDFLWCRLCSRMQPQVLFSEQIRSQRLDVLKPIEPKNKANRKANGKCCRKKNHLYMV